MILYPTIELLDGRCVSLFRGRIDEPQIWHVDPVEMACGFAAEGAQAMQITDFDAVQGSDRNAGLIAEIIRAAGIPVTLAGGMRTRDSVERWLDKGAARAVIGTLATRDHALVWEIAKYRPDQIVVALDVFRGSVMVDGWTNQTAITAEALIEAYHDTPLAAFSITDIDTDIGDTDGSLGVISGLAALSRSPVIASGVVRTTDDISRLKYTPNISGAIVGRALFNKTIALGDALMLAAAPVEAAAGFK